MNLTTLKAYSGLEFRVRPEGPDDGPILLEFWRHVSGENLPSRYTGMDDPRLPDPAGSQDDQRTTFLAFAGDGKLISIAILAAGLDRKVARVMLFTGDGGAFHGISWALLEHVLFVAQAEGIETVTSVFSAEDARAIRLERQMGFVEGAYPGDKRLRSLTWTLSHPQQPAPSELPATS